MESLLPAVTISSGYKWNPDHPIGTCAGCGGEMIYNVPRLGEAGGFVHKKTGKFICPAQCKHETNQITVNDGIYTCECGYFFSEDKCHHPSSWYSRSSPMGNYCDVCGKYLDGENSEIEEYLLTPREFTGTGEIVQEGDESALIGHYNWGPVYSSVGKRANDPLCKHLLFRTTRPKPLDNPVLP